MTGGNLARAVGGDLRRHWRHLVAGGAGIALTIAALAFFVALWLGVRGVLLGEVFPLHRVEVHRRAAELNLLAVKLALGSDTIGDEELAAIGGIEGVAAVYPKMRLLAPAVATGGEALLGTAMQTELVADGIDPSLVADRVGGAFHDPTVDPRNASVPCTGDGGCPSGTACVGATSFRSGSCREPIPVIVSEHMVELYNGAFSRAYRLPKINPEALIGLGLDVDFGASSLRPTGRRTVRERLVLVGFSDAAMPLGVTLPLGFVKRLNRQLGPAGAADGYHSAVVEIRSADAAPGVTAAIEALGLEVRDRGARRIATALAVVLAIATAVGAAVLAVASLHVMHVFALLAMFRRREIGVLRAVGASRRDIRSIFVIEAAVVGLAAGAAGLVCAVAIAEVADRLRLDRLPDFPFAPESLFVFPAWLLAGALGVAALASVLGALGPVLRATAADPAELVSGG
ncbi:MAG: FtsX-like permease family protein [Thermoanaerobaculales bacterium]|jgi:hypothetical protein|nr:FtsX-like permease family protein [Thermoanaerobaculales bacterium]